MPHHQPLRRFGAAVAQVKSPPNRHHQGEQEQRKSDAQYRQSAAAFVAKRVLRDEPGQCHRLTPERTGNGAQKAGTSQPSKDRRSTSLSTTGQIRFVPCSECSCPRSQFSSASVLFESGSHQDRGFSTSIVSCIDRARKWRSSSGLDDKCHTRLGITITTAQACIKSRSILANGGTKPCRGCVLALWLTSADCREGRTSALSGDAVSTLGTLRTVFRAYLGNSKVGTGGDILAIRIPWVSARRALSAAARKARDGVEREKINAYENRPLRNP